MYLAFPTVYRAYPRQPDRPHHNYNKAPNDGMAEIYLLVSRDGKNFTIPAKTAYVSPGTEEEPDRGYLSMAVGIIEKMGQDLIKIGKEQGLVEAVVVLLEAKRDGSTKSQRQRIQKLAGDQLRQLLVAAAPWESRSGDPRVRRGCKAPAP